MIDKVYKLLGSHGCDSRAELDLYTTPPDAVISLLEHESFSKNVWECACGLGHISDVLASKGYNVYSTDIKNYGYAKQHDTFDFLNCDKSFNGDIVTNPPYKMALPFVKKALQFIPNGNRVAMLLRIQFLEGQERHLFFVDNPPAKIYVFSKRIQCSKHGKALMSNGAICFCWFIWVKGYKGDPIVKWL